MDYASLRICSNIANKVRVGKMRHIIAMAPPDQICIPSRILVSIQDTSFTVLVNVQLAEWQPGNRIQIFSK